MKLNCSINFYQDFTKCLSGSRSNWTDSTVLGFKHMLESFIQLFFSKLRINFELYTDGKKFSKLRGIDFWGKGK